MTSSKPVVCPECSELVPQRGSVDRRGFLRATSAGALGVMLGGAATRVLGQQGAPAAAAPAAAAAAEAKPAESLVRELFASLTSEQKQSIVLPWDHGKDDGVPTRLRTFNAPPLGKALGEAFSKPQQELIDKTLRAILSGDEAYERLTRHGTWDGAGSFEGNGVAIFGDPSGTERFSWVFAGHHLTLRCDGNSQPNTSFGGPMYYGHSESGDSKDNVYRYQTEQVMSVFEALDATARHKAFVMGSPGDGREAIRFREKTEARPGIPFADLDADRQALVTKVMRTLLEPFRAEDGDEVMKSIEATGGMRNIHLAYYKDTADETNQDWQSWRLEGPGFVWNYRVMPHVHCFVNISDKISDHA